MTLELTPHAEQRRRKRGILLTILECVTFYGRIEHTYNKRVKIFLPHKVANKKIMELKWEIENSGEPQNILKARKAIKALDKAAGKEIIEENGKIITVYVRY
jgi:hypothetical protein